MLTLEKAACIVDAALRRGRELEVGISGDHPDQDAACGVFGVESANLTADPGATPRSSA